MRFPKICRCWYSYKSVIEWLSSSFSSFLRTFGDLENSPLHSRFSCLKLSKPAWVYVLSKKENRARANRWETASPVHSFTAWWLDSRCERRNTLHPLLFPFNSSPYTGCLVASFHYYVLSIRTEYGANFMPVLYFSIELSSEKSLIFLVEIKAHFNELYCLKYWKYSNKPWDQFCRAWNFLQKSFWQNYRIFDSLVLRERQSKTTRESEKMMWKVSSRFGRFFPIENR